MRKVNLEELVPTESEFTLEFTGKTYHLNKFTMADSAWVREKFMDFEQRFRRNDPDLIAALVMRLMKPEDRADFTPRSVKTYNVDTGEEGEVKLGGAPLFKEMVKGGPKEQIEIITAIVRTIGLSQPIVEEMVEGEKKRVQSLLAGQGSLSSASTNGDSSPKQSSA